MPSRTCTACSVCGFVASGASLCSLYHGSDECPSFARSFVSIGSLVWGLRSSIGPCGLHRPDVCAGFVRFGLFCLFLSLAGFVCPTKSDRCTVRFERTGQYRCTVLYICRSSPYSLCELCCVLLKRFITHRRSTPLTPLTPPPLSIVCGRREGRVGIVRGGVHQPSASRVCCLSSECLRQYSPARTSVFPPSVSVHMCVFRLCESAFLSHAICSVPIVAEVGRTVGGGPNHSFHPPTH